MKSFSFLKRVSEKFVSVVAMLALLLSGVAPLFAYPAVAAAETVSSTTPLASDSSFVYPERSIRIHNDTVDIATVVMVPAAASAVRFTYTQTDGTNVYTNVSGVEHVQAGQFPVTSTGAHRYYGYVDADEGVYAVTGEFQIDSTWYPITGGATVNVFATPMGSFVSPTATQNIFRPGDNPARITVSDHNQSFGHVKFIVDGSTSYTVDRAQCDLRSAGNRVLCDVNDAAGWTPLSEGSHTVSAVLYNRANGNVALASTSFTVDGTAPALTNLALDPATGPYDTSVAASAEVTDANGIKNVTFTVTAPRASDNKCDGNGTVLTKEVATATSAGDTYTKTLDLHALTNGDYCVNAVAEDIAANHNRPVSLKITVAHPADTVPPAAPTITAPGARTWHKTTPITDTWTAVSDPSGIAKYQIAYQYDDGHTFSASTCPGLTMSGVTGFIGCRDVAGSVTSRNHTPAPTEEGGVTIWARAVDGAGNVGDWSKSVHYFYDHTAPTTDIHVSVSSTTLTVSGSASDNLALNRVYVQLVSREDGHRYGGITINLIPDGKTASWTKTYDIQALGYPFGDFAANVSVVDMAGNSYNPGWTADYTVGAPPTEPPGDTTVPAVAITSATQVSSATVSFMGSVSDDNLNYYYCYLTTDQTVTVGGATYTPGQEISNTRNPNCLTTWAHGQNSFSGVLGGFDITGVPSGNYTINLVARDLSGNTNASTPATYGMTISQSEEATSTPSVTTDAVTDVASTTVTLNGTNGSFDADRAAFWWGTTTQSSFTAAPNPGNQLPQGWSNHYALAPLANATTSYAASGLTPNTTYYYVAWVRVAGVWYPGAIESFTTADTEEGEGGSGVTPPHAAEQTSEDVFPSDIGANLASWYFYDDNNDTASNVHNADHRITSNPVTISGDTGAVELDGGNNKRNDLATIQYVGTKLADIAQIGYSAYQPTTNVSGENNAPFLGLDINFATTSSANYYQGRLTFVPGIAGNTPVPTRGAWQSYEGVASNAMWTWSGFVANGNKWPDGTTAEYRTWNDIINAFPDAEITGQFVIRAGDPYQFSFNAYVDHVFLATAATNVRYDFELAEAAPHVTLTSSGGGGTETLVGDLNHDGKVDILDLALLMYAYNHYSVNTTADLNNDKAVNLSDLAILLSHWTGS